MTRSFVENRRAVWIVSAVALVLFLVTNLPWQLDDYDQAKQAFTSFEMVKEGHWLYQRTPHERVATKPPLVGWISAGIFEVTRSWDLAWRLPSIAAAIALSILLFRAGSAYGAIGGLIAMSAFAFNLLTPRLASLVRTDMPLALVVFLIGRLIWEKIRQAEGWESRDRLWLFALLTLGMLIKGPIVYAFLFPGVLMFVWSRRKTVVTSRGCGWSPWIGSLLIFLVWVVVGSLSVPGFFDQVVMREFVGRFGETVHRPQPIYFYLPHLLHKFAPWSVLMIALAIVDLRAPDKLDGLKPSSLAGKRNRRKLPPEIFWLICWSLGGLLVMSLIPSKRVDRIFPVIPPLCLLLAAQLGRSSVQLRSRVFQWSAVALLLSILFAAGYSGFKVFTGYRDHRDALVKFGRAVREQAMANRWRYEVIEASDEGLLLYLQKLHFIRPQNAIAEWNRGNLDALVVSEREGPQLVRDLQNATLSALHSVERKDERGSYTLIIR
jgi:4-amino-4-deoxy-L-arabinose transferase-like glycosyltransferase